MDMVARRHDYIRARSEAKRTIFKVKNDERKRFCEDLEREKMTRAICLEWPSSW